jgi:hypothetical protein
MAEYADKALEAQVIAKLSKLPPLVQATECEDLKARLAKAAAGKAFIVQGGDCAERFIDCEADRLEAQLKVLIQMGSIVSEATGNPAVVIARIAGQYGKPRSKPTEVVEGHGEIMSFKGDNINGYEPAERKWDPQRLLDGYFHSTATLNFLRSMRMSADLKPVFDIDIGFLSGSAEHAQNIKIAAGVKKSAKPAEASVFFTAHEAMQLNLEQALTRPVGDKHYNLSAHMVWIGDRTRQLLGGHVEYFRGIANPIGVKVGPSMKDDELADLVRVLNPHKEAGKLVIITRYGHDKIEEYLPGHIAAVKARARAGARAALRAARVVAPVLAVPRSRLFFRRVRPRVRPAGAGDWHPGCVAVRRRARKHHHRQVGQPQNALVRRRDDRVHQGIRRAPRRRQRPRRRPPRAHRPGERHGVHGWLRARVRGRPHLELRDLVRPALQLQAGDRGGLHVGTRTRPGGRRGRK